MLFRSRAIGTERTVSNQVAFVIAMALAFGIAGCTSGDGSGSATGSMSLAALPVLPGFGITAQGKPVDVYVKFARLAKLCWLSAPAPLQQGYLFTADASPEARGGAVSIVIYEKNAAPGIAGGRGLVAYFMALTPSGDAATSVSVENARIAAGFAAKMQTDVERWAVGETGCNEASAWPTQAAKGEASEPGPSSTTKGAVKLLKAVAAKKK